jgi:prolyl-tRNA synthetase
MRKLTPKSKDPDKWYTDVVLTSGLADYSPVRGMMVIRPYGYAIWERIQKTVDEGIKKRGVKNAYFPLFIPASFLQKEKEHVEGFSPQLAVVTHGGGKKLGEPLIVRPTSETIMYPLYAKWIQSWRDLPLLLNQWGNVIRWEMRTTLFLRTTEFLWNEGHTAHASQKEADDFAREILRMYTNELIRPVLAMDFYEGSKTQSEKFAGADITYTMEALMTDLKALQLGTSHNLGQNFAKVFNISFLDKDGSRKFVWQTSWAVTTRLIGALVLVHGDDHGLVLPPYIAPIQVVIVPIWKNEKEKDSTTAYGRTILKALKQKGLRAELDEREGYSPGWKYHEWELKGVPLRLEIGPKEVKEKKVSLALRDTFKKETMSRASFEKNAAKILDSIQDRLFKKHQEFTKKNTHPVKDWKELRVALEKKAGFLEGFLCDDPKCEKAISGKTKATPRVRPFSTKEEKGKCVVCGASNAPKTLFAKSY